MCFTGGREALVIMVIVIITDVIKRIKRLCVIYISLSFSLSLSPQQASADIPMFTTDQSPLQLQQMSSVVLIGSPLAAAWSQR